MSNRRCAQQRGHSSESLAALWLKLKGYRILERRLRTRAGEIDLVAAAPFGPVCFVEVKARGLARSAAESVTASQQTRIARAACLYLASRPALARRGARFDIIAIAPHALPVHHRDVWQADF
ncbi:MAG TPA: YraN family protein [Rhizomicrobium sp.]|nr:YraN family protein [Rhizomicrobium sp.]